MSSRVSAAAALAVAVALGGCGSDSDNAPDGLDATDDPASEASTPATDEPRDEAQDGDEGTDADEEALLELFDEFWAAAVASENGPDTDPALFEDVAGPDLIEERVARAREWEELGFHREGEPALEHVTVRVNGDEARIEFCRDEQEWLVLDDEGEPFDVETSGFTANVMTAERSDDKWLFMDLAGPSEATITCE